MEIVRSRAFSGLGSSSNTNSIITSAALLTTSILSLQLHSVLANNIAVRYSFLKISSGVVNSILLDCFGYIVSSRVCTCDYRSERIVSLSNTSHR